MKSGPLVPPRISVKKLNKRVVAKCWLWNTGFFSRTTKSFVGQKTEDTIGEDLTGTGNRAWKASGTQGSCEVKILKNEIKAAAPSSF